MWVSLTQEIFSFSSQQDPLEDEVLEGLSLAELGFECLSDTLSLSDLRPLQSIQFAKAAYRNTHHHLNPADVTILWAWR